MKRIDPEKLYEFATIAKGAVELFKELGLSDDEATREVVNILMKHWEVADIKSLLAYMHTYNSIMSKVRNAIEGVSVHAENTSQASSKEVPKGRHLSTPSHTSDTKS